MGSEMCIRDRTCRKCKGKDHFASVCKSRPKKRGVNQVQEDLEANAEQVDYAFRVTKGVHSNVVKLSVGGVKLEMLVVLEPPITLLMKKPGRI